MQDKKTRFIPTLTEVIDGSSAQMGLELPEEPESAASDFEERETSESIATNAIEDERRISVSSLFGYVPVPSAPRVSGQQKQEIEAVVERGKVQIAVNLDTCLGKIEEQEDLEVSFKGVIGAPVLSKPESVKKAGLSREEVQKAKSEPLESELLFGEIEGEKDIFSPLSRNPAATQDSLRPSDLMLVALTDRIAAKARAKIGEKLEQQIQDKIFPLLDGFAEQLVKHIEGDLLKIMREGLAEATREELDRLRKK